MLQFALLLPGSQSLGRKLLEGIANHAIHKLLTIMVMQIRLPTINTTII